MVAAVDVAAACTRLELPTLATATLDPTAAARPASATAMDAMSARSAPTRTRLVKEGLLQVCVGRNEI